MSCRILENGQKSVLWNKIRETVDSDQAADKLFNKAFTQEFKEELGYDWTQNNISSSTKQGVSELFNSNPELANAVYEALGFKNLENNLGIPEIADVEDGKLYQFKTKDGLIGGVLISPTEFRIDGISAYEVGKGQGTKLFEGLINYLSSNGITTLSTISAGEGAVKMHNKAVEKGLLTKIKEDGRTATFKINSYITPQQKQEAQQLYNDFLDVYLQNYEQVEKILKQENKIEKDCGGGKLKAEKGLSTSFTKGGKWKLIKDLKGYPTHKEGGIDLTIGKDGVRIKNGNTEFIAKHGLVIPKN